MVRSCVITQVIKAEAVSCVTEWGNRNSLWRGGQDFRYTEQADVEAIRSSTPLALISQARTGT
jgi:hypothetical protein